MRLPANLLLLALNLFILVLHWYAYVTYFSVTDHQRGGIQTSDIQRLTTEYEVIEYKNPGRLDDDDVEAFKQPIASSSKWDWNWDGRQSQGEQKTKATRFLYLVRHGQYYGSGPSEGHLSPLGKRQAKFAGKRLKSLNLTFHRIIASTSTRAKETVEIIHEFFSEHKIENTHLLKEGWPVFPDPASPGVWNRDDEHFKIDGPRIAEGFTHYIHRAESSQDKDSNEMIVAHGNVIAYILLRALQLPPERWLKLSVMQGSITLLILLPSGDVSVRVMGDVGHIPKGEWSG